MGDLKFTFYGVRGSYPVSNQDVIEYGGNTASVLIETSTTHIVLDAGTGIIKIGKELIKKYEKSGTLDIFLSHLHLDHIQGLSFLDPIFFKDWCINLYCPKYERKQLEKYILTLFNQPFSPISRKGIKSQLNFLGKEEMGDGSVRIGDMEIRFVKDHSHPLEGVLLYSIITKSGRMVYATDVETPQGLSSEYLEFIRGADILIHDSQYLDSDYHHQDMSRVGYGHSTVSMAAQNALAGKVNRLFLFHYDPMYSDEDVSKMLKTARNVFKETYLARELQTNILRR